LNNTILSLIAIILVLAGFVVYNDVVIPYIEEKETTSYNSGVGDILIDQTQNGVCYVIQDEQVVTLKLNSQLDLNDEGFVTSSPLS
jgi:hypothetical protein